MMPKTSLKRRSISLISIFSGSPVMSSTNVHPSFA